MYFVLFFLLYLYHGLSQLMLGKPKPNILVAFYTYFTQEPT